MNLFFTVLLLDPRFWAEEGALYFHHALVSPGLKDFFSPALGYYSLVVKIAVYLALFVPIENAPLITTVMSGLVIWSCVVLIITSSNDFLAGFGVKCAFALMLLFISSGEIWLNTITSQFWFPIAREEFRIQLRQIELGQYGIQSCQGRVVKTPFGHPYYCPRKDRS